ncbi:MAG: hypothetical protein ABIY38_03185, partial [Rhodococcus sp. (in: high G+C Gram-positive bacteria)]
SLLCATIPAPVAAESTGQEVAQAKQIDTEVVDASTIITDPLLNGWVGDVTHNLWRQVARNMMASPEFVTFAKWDSPERLILSMSTLYRLWEGKPAAPPSLVRRVAAFAAAGAMLRKEQ